MVPSDVESQESGLELATQSVFGEESLTPIQSLCLTRLENLTEGAHDYAQQPDHDTWLLAVLQKAAYSVYCDCVEAGFEDKAKEILEKVRNPK